MAAFKNKENGTWYVQFRYTDWKGERQQKFKRGFATKRDALAWERDFLHQKQADINMTFESFAHLYEKDVIYHKILSAYQRAGRDYITQDAKKQPYYQDLPIPL